MEIKLEIEKILKEKGITPPSMSREEFIERLGEKLKMEIPEKVAEIINNAHREIVAEELERLGRDAVCKFYQGPKKCTKGLDATQCLECLSYKPRREWQKWLLQRVAPERVEWGVIGVGTAALVLAIISPELQFWVVIFWFIMFILARLQVILQWKLIRILNRGTLRWLK